MRGTIYNQRHFVFKNKKPFITYTEDSGWVFNTEIVLVKLIRTGSTNLHFPPRMVTKERYTKQAFLLEKIKGKFN